MSRLRTPAPIGPAQLRGCRGLSVTIRYRPPSLLLLVYARSLRQGLTAQHSQMPSWGNEDTCKRGGQVEALVGTGAKRLGWHLVRVLRGRIGVAGT